MQREFLKAFLCLVGFASACSGGGGSKQVKGRSARGNQPPVISGSPPASIAVGDSYSFIPAAGDPEGRSLRLSIQNKPAWATFDSKTGRLLGTPEDRDVGIYVTIAIAVSDGKSTVSLPAFEIAVNQQGTARSRSPGIR